MWYANINKWTYAPHRILKEKISLQLILEMHHIATPNLFLSAIIDELTNYHLFSIIIL